MGSILESLGHPWRDIFHKKVELFSDPVLGWLLVPLFSRFFIDFVQVFGGCFAGFVTRLANSETSILAAI